MCFPIGVGMKESTTKDYKVINEEIFNPIEKKKEVQHYTCTDIISDINPEAMFADGFDAAIIGYDANCTCLLYTSPSPRDVEESRMPSSA